MATVIAARQEEWTDGRRYLGPDVLARSRITPRTSSDTAVTTQIQVLRA